VMIDALVWSARILATLNIGIALLMLWGASKGTTGGETIARVAAAAPARRFGRRGGHILPLRE
jgi:hypothetical protein